MLVDQLGFSGLFFTLLGIWIIENAASGFSSQSAGFHVLHQEWGRTKLFPQGFVKIFEDMKTRIEPDQVD